MKLTNFIRKCFCMDLLCEERDIGIQCRRIAQGHTPKGNMCATHARLYDQVWGVRPQDSSGFTGFVVSGMLVPPHMPLLGVSERPGPPMLPPLEIKLYQRTRRSVDI